MNCVHSEPLIHLWSTICECGGFQEINLVTQWPVKTYENLFELQFVLESNLEKGSRRQLGLEAVQASAQSRIF